MGQERVYKPLVNTDKQPSFKIYRSYTCLPLYLSTIYLPLASIAVSDGLEVMKGNDMRGMNRYGSKMHNLLL